MNDGDGGPMRGQGRHLMACYWMRGKEQHANNRNPQADIGVLRHPDLDFAQPDPTSGKTGPIKV
jgi:hypothetical protein